MTVSERIEALAARLSELTRLHPELPDLWEAVDAEIASIVAMVQTEADQRALDSGYSDLMAKADVMGLLTPE